MKKSILARLLISATCLFTAGAVGTVGVLSILSDVVVNDGTFTATENYPLDIAGAYQVYINGSITPEATNDVTLEPGDVAVVKATITNYGSASAWVTDSIQSSFPTANNFYLSTACGEFTAADFEDGSVSNTPSTCLGGAVGGDETTFIVGKSTTIRVLNGTGTNAQIETPANAPESLIADVDAMFPVSGYNEAMFIGSNSYSVAYTFYFDPDTAATSGEAVSFDAKTVALQYRNNNSLFPVYTCDEADPPVCTSPWDVVVSYPIGQ